MIHTPETTPSPEQPDQITLLGQALESRRSVLGEEKYLAIAEQLEKFKELQKAIDAEKKNIAKKEAALRQASVGGQAGATTEVNPAQEKIDNRSIPVINPEISPIIENIERDISLKNIDPSKLETAIFHSGSGFAAKGTSGSDVLDRTINYETLDDSGKSGFEQLTRKNKILSIYYGIGTNLNASATTPARAGGSFGTALENIPDDVSSYQKSKLASIIKQTMLEVINSDKFNSITTTSDKKDILVRGKIPDEDVIKFKGLIANVIKEYQASYEKMHSDVQDTKTEAAPEVTQIIPSQEVVQEKETSLESGPTLQEKIEKLVDFIEHSPDIKFVVGARGNLLGIPEKPTNGHADFFYNNSTQQMESAERNFPSLDDNTFRLTENNVRKEDIPGVEELNIYFKGNNAFILKRLPFRNTGKRTDILSDLRTGNHLSQALVYDKKLPASIKDPVLKELLGNPDFKVIVPALEMYTQKYARDYYNFVQECIGKEPVTQDENRLDQVRSSLANKKELQSFINFARDQMPSASAEKFVLELREITTWLGSGSRMEEKKKLLPETLLPFVHLYQSISGDFSRLIGNRIEKEELKNNIAGYRKALEKFDTTIYQNGVVALQSEIETLQEYVTRNENQSNEKKESDENSIEDWEKKYVPFPDPKGYFWNNEQNVLSSYDPSNSAYEIFIDPNDPTKAKFRFLVDSKSVDPAIKSYDVFLEPICDIKHLEFTGSKIKQSGFGELRLSSDKKKWELVPGKKLAIAITGPEGFDFDKKEAPQAKPESAPITTEETKENNAVDPLIEKMNSSERPANAFYLPIPSDTNTFDSAYEMKNLTGASVFDCWPVEGDSNRISFKYLDSPSLAEKIAATPSRYARGLGANTASHGVLGMKTIKAGIAERVGAEWKVITPPVVQYEYANS